jgi:hypothetical protein
MGGHCEWTLTPGASWAQGAALPADMNGVRFRLVVTCDATGLPAGEYHTTMQVAESDLVARCLPITFIVEPTASTPEIGQPEVRQKTWGAIKSGYR